MTIFDETVSRCAECGSPNVYHDKDKGEVTCLDCGFVLVPKTADFGPEWRAMEEEGETRARTGAPVTLTMHDMGLSTKIGRVKRSNNPQSGLADEVSILKKWEKRTQVTDSYERNLHRGLLELSGVCSALSLPAVVAETSSAIFRKIAKLKLVRGRSSKALAAAVVYLACKQCGVARMMHEIANVAAVPKKEMNRSYRLLVSNLSVHSPPVDFKIYVSRFVNQLNLKGDVEKLALEIIEKAKAVGITSGRGPIGLAAASTYLSAVLLNRRMTQREIAGVAKITEVTIRNRYKELINRLDLKVMI